MNKYPLAGASSDGMTSQAMQQGGMGLILTTLILTAPPMAAMFFQGTLGSFMAYSQIGGSPVAQAPGPSGQPPGSYYTPEKPSVTSGHVDSNSTNRASTPVIPMAKDGSGLTDGKFGSAR